MHLYQSELQNGILRIIFYPHFNLQLKNRVADWRVKEKRVNKNGIQSEGTKSYQDFRVKEQKVKRISEQRNTE